MKYKWISTVILTGTMEQVGISIGFEFEVEWVEDLLVKDKDGKDGAEGKTWCWIGLSMWHLMRRCKRWVMVLMPASINGDAKLARRGKKEHSKLGAVMGNKDNGARVPIPIGLNLVESSGLYGE